MAILAFLVACGGQEETQAPAQITPIEPPETFPEPVPDEPGDEVFAMYERIVEEVANPSPLESGTANAETHAVKRLVWKAGTATYQEQLCATWANEVFGTLWSFPPGFVDRQPVVERSVRSSDEGFDFEGGPHIDLLGTDVSEGRLPTEPDDAGVIDEDADGKPGVTVLIDNNLLGSGEVYVVQRSTSRLRGLWVDEEQTTASGEVLAEVEQNTLDATTWWLRIDVGADNVPLPDESFFVFTKVDPSMDCEQIYDERVELGITERPL